MVARPSTKTSPEVGISSAFTILSAVVFPEPLRPSRTRVLPFVDFESEPAQNFAPVDAIPGLGETEHQPQE